MAATQHNAQFTARKGGKSGRVGAAVSFDDLETVFVRQESVASEDLTDGKPIFRQVSLASQSTSASDSQLPWIEYPGSEVDSDDEIEEVIEPKQCPTLELQRAVAECFAAELIHERPLYLSQLNNLYTMRGGTTIPHKQHGFSNLSQFVKSIPGVHTVGRGCQMRLRLASREAFDEFRRQCPVAFAAPPMSLEGEPEVAPDKFLKPKLIQGEILTKLHGFLSRYPDGISANSCISEWAKTFGGQKMPFRDCGFRDLRGFFANCPGVTRIGRGMQTKYQLTRAPSDTDSTQISGCETLEGTEASDNDSEQGSNRSENVALMTSWAAAAAAAASSSSVCVQPSALDTMSRWRRSDTAPAHLELGVVASAPPAVSTPGRDVPAGDLGAYGVLCLLQTQLSSCEPSVIVGLGENEVAMVAMNSLFKKLRGQGPHEMETEFLSMVHEGDSSQVHSDFLQLSLAGEAKTKWPMRILRACGSGACTAVLADASPLSGRWWVLNFHAL